jgi:hypothetical protein
MTCYGVKTVVIKTSLYIMLVLPEENVGLKSSLGVVTFLLSLTLVFTCRNVPGVVTQLSPLKILSVAFHEMVE